MSATSMVPSAREIELADYKLGQFRNDLDLIESAVEYVTTATKIPKVSLDVSEMTDMQLVRELGRLHWELLNRVDGHYLYGAGFPEDNEGDTPDPARLDQGLLLAARLDEMTRQFREGGIIGPDQDGDKWYVGLDHFHEKILEWTIRLDASGGAS